MASDYQNIIQVGGPSAYNMTDGVLLMLDESSDQLTAADTMKTAEMETAGWGNATAHTASKNGTVTLGVTGKTLLTGAADYCASFTGAGHLLPDDAADDFDFTATTAFSGGLRLQHNTAVAGGAAEWGLITRNVDTTNYRGFRLALFRNGASEMWLRFWKIDNVGSGTWTQCQDTTPLVPGTTYTIAFGTSATNTAASMWIEVNGSRANNVTSTGGGGVPTTITGGTLRVGADDATTGLLGGAGATAAYVAGVWLTKRETPTEVVQLIHDAATTAAATRTYSRNLGVIKKALQNNCLARGIGDSTSTTGGTSITDHLPRRFQTDGLINRRAAHFKALYGHLSGSTDPVYIASVTATEINGTPAAPWATPVGAKPGIPFVVLTHDAANTPANTVEAYFTDDAADPMNAATWPSFSARFISARANSASAVDTQRFQITDGTTTTQTADIAIDGANAAFLATNLALGASTAGTLVCRLVGGANNESSLQYGGYGVMYTRSSDLSSDVPSGMWWFGSSGLDGSATGSWDDDTIFAMSAITTQDAAFISGISVSFAYKVVFVQLTINDINVANPAATAAASLVAIAARWTALGYRVCFIQPWLCYFASGTSAATRVPVTAYDDYWNDAFLPVAGGNVAVVSIAQRWRGVPFQFLEGPASPAYSIHAANSPSALRLSLAITEALDEASAGGGGSTASDQFFLQQLLSEEE